MPVICRQRSVSAFFGPFKGTAHQHKEYDLLLLPIICGYLRNYHSERRGSGRESIRFVAVEPVKIFPRGGTLHALHQRTENQRTSPPSGALPGWTGHWPGMTLYKTGHDHGGRFRRSRWRKTPAFLHGINGEDYFTFAR